VELEFEWDEEKARTNLAKHGVSFLTAAEIFANEILERIDDREDYGGVRFIALDRVDEKCAGWFSLGAAKISSASSAPSKANRDEKEIYHRATFP